jgi:hypothetical protein
MSFKNKNMSVIAYANGFTLWHYNAVIEQETFDNILEEGYFNNVKTLMNKGDMFLINATDKSGIAFLIEENPNVKLTTKIN